MAGIGDISEAYGVLGGGRLDSHFGAFAAVSWRGASVRGAFGLGFLEVLQRLLAVI